MRSLHRYVGTLRFFRRHPRLARTPIGGREQRRARIWMRVIRHELAQTRTELRNKVRPVVVPTWFVADALCVHSGWHYSLAKRGEYVMFGHAFQRTDDVPDSIAGGTGEGSWDEANYPYGGGLQMDGGFQSNYGSEFLTRYGAADRWPAAVQILVAYRGWLVQGWGAWPNTSRACGLR